MLTLVSEGCFWPGTVKRAPLFLVSPMLQGTLEAWEEQGGCKAWFGPPCDEPKWKTILAPEKWWLEDYFPIGNGTLQRATLNFTGVYNQKVSESHIVFGKSPGTHAPVLDTSCIITPPPPIMVPLQCPGDLIFHFHDSWREGHLG